MLYFLLLVLCAGIAFDTKQFLLLGCIFLCICVLLFIYRKFNEKFGFVRLKPQKAILLLSFWGCGFMCFKAFEKSFCLSCMQSFLSRSLNNIYDSSFKAVLQGHNRFYVMVSLACVLLLAVTLFSRNKRC